MTTPSYAVIFTLGPSLGQIRTIPTLGPHSYNSAVIRVQHPDYNTLQSVKTSKGDRKGWMQQLSREYHEGDVFE